MLKAVLLTLLVVAGPVQAQLAHFCSVMEQVIETCCCGHDELPERQISDGCPEGTAEPCCRTVVNLVVDEAAAAAIPPAARQGVPAHDPPRLALLPGATLPAPVPHAAVSAAPPQSDLSGSGSRTYLRTLRLRL